MKIFGELAGDDHPLPCVYRDELRVKRAGVRGHVKGMIIRWVRVRGKLPGAVVVCVSARVGARARSDVATQATTWDPMYMSTPLGVSKRQIRRMALSHSPGHPLLSVQKVHKRTRAFCTSTYLNELVPGAA